ncbi:hypothetical protein NPIL_478781 [Nephila pilipes]|uniref:Uncharacterized protein n=1 Tax=Nephila pilipes TaxID=299642 RepID=A0A8X6MSH8_NEPPI|nr:hypothetical protein NPIL_478781 [Nephila pilipes]
MTRYCLLRCHGQQTDKTWIGDLILKILCREDFGTRRGLCVNLVLQCIYCGQATCAMSSDMTNGFDDINIRLAFGMLCIRKDNSAAKTFCVVMNLPPPPAKFERYNNILLRSNDKSELRINEKYCRRYCEE